MKNQNLIENYLGNSPIIDESGLGIIASIRSIKPNFEPIKIYIVTAKAKPIIGSVFISVSVNAFYLYQGEFLHFSFVGLDIDLNSFI
jgi:hypothetical protein